jgi:uncharacterized membrane protein
LLFSLRTCAGPGGVHGRAGPHRRFQQWWKRFGVWAWPTIVLVDKKGIIRYSHIGEGAYNKTESVIKQLLADMH